MRLSLHYLTLLTFLSGALTLADPVPLIQETNLNLEVTSGESSLLLSWTIPDSIHPTEIRVLRSESPEGNFNPVVVLQGKQTRFEDRDVHPENRYFYRIEFENGDGSVIVNNSKAPPFGRCVPVNLDSRPDSAAASNFESLFHWTFRSTFRIKHPDISTETEKAIETLIFNEKPIDHPWLTLVSPDNLNAVHTAFQSWSSDSGLHDVSVYLEKLAPVVRNHLRMLPDEWEKQVSGDVQKGQSRIDNLNAEWNDDIQLLNTLPGVVPVRIQAIPDSAFILDLKVLYPDVIRSERLWIEVNGDTTFPEVSDSARQGILLRWIIAPDAKTGKVYAGKETTYPLVFDASKPITNIYLSGDVDFVDRDIPNGIWTAPDPQPVYINEWTWNPTTGQLSIELWNPELIKSEWAVRIDDKSVWQLDYAFVSENSYLDSAVAVPEADGNPHWLSIGSLVDDQWIQRNAIPLDLASATGQSRNDDGGYWIDGSSSLGRTNKVEVRAAESANIPEVFALYQNYPNPFNNSTTISFDLLRSAKISLYVLDARGRVVDKFAENEPMDHGKYTYSWSGNNRASGIYFFTVSAQIADYQPVVYSRKMIYLK